MAAKILYVITKSNWGGAQKYVYTLATAFAHKGHETAVALGGTGHPGAYQGPLAERLADAGIRTVFLRSFARDIGLLRDLGAFFELMRIIRRERPDVLHLNSSKAGGLGALAGWLCRVPTIVFTAHGWPFSEQRGFLSRALIYFFSSVTALFADRVIVVSDYDLRMARKMPFAAKKAVRIYNGVAREELGTGERIRAAFPAGARITGTIGELTHNKNHVALIEEARERPDRYIAIVGEGEERARLEEKIRAYGLSERVKLFGFMPAKDVLRGFDEFVLPSVKEGLPYVLLEAKAAGLPLRANRVGGVGEILDAPDLSLFTEENMIAQTARTYGLSVTA